MATRPPSPQRAWRAACPHCGAPVDFRSAASASAVCSYCHSTLLRDGDALRRIGESAELFDDHSPLQLGASGRYQGTAFTLVGRLQHGYADGTWNEWHALFDNGRSGWLSEDNGRYVFAFDAPLSERLPPASAWRAGERHTIAGQSWVVASVVEATLIAAAGELPRPPVHGAFTVVDLRNAQDEVATIDHADPAAPAWSIGRPVLLSALSMQGLREASEKTLSAQGLACPQCGAALSLQLASTKSLTCGQCASVVDVSGGAQALTHYRQAAGGEPQIPLGSTGLLALPGEAPQPWQVVGYLERCDVPDDADDETSFWREYLLYNRNAGFAFLVDTDEGWSLVHPITGAPVVRGDRATWQGRQFRRRWRYHAKVTHVRGEFYWRVRRDEHAQVEDYEAGRQRLSREQTADEVTWSHGEVIEAREVAKAFGIELAPVQRDAAPVAAKSGGFFKGVMWVLFIGFMITMFTRCDRDRDCTQVRATFGEASNEYQQCLRSGGGTRLRGSSYGGFGSGGSHK